jgi:hypothetical protein
MFAREREEVSFVVKLIMAIRKHKNQPVSVQAGFPADEAACHGRAELRSCFPHPPYCNTIHTLSQSGGIHSESGGEHFRQNNQISFSGEWRQLFTEIAQIGLNIFPDKTGLYDGNTHFEEFESKSKRLFRIFCRWQK